MLGASDDDLVEARVEQIDPGEVAHALGFGHLLDDRFEAARHLGSRLNSSK